MHAAVHICHYAGHLGPHQNTLHQKSRFFSFCAAQEVISLIDAPRRKDFKSALLFARAALDLEIQRFAEILRKKYFLFIISAGCNFLASSFQTSRD